MTVSAYNRDSNMELLRIMAMSMILIIHFLNHAIYVDDQNNDIYRLISPFFISGVNLFFLISGWFQIKLSLKSLYKLIITIVIFTIVNAIGYVIYGGGGSESYATLLKLLAFPISGNYYWFIAVYLGLIIISPIINMGLENLDSRNLRIVMILYTIFTVYSCGIGHNICNSNGYTFGQAIYLYCLAYWIKQEEGLLNKIPRIAYLLIAVIFTLITAILFRLTGILSITAYNSIFIILISIAILLYFSKLYFTNKYVNRIATASLGCYLLQDGLLGRIVYNWQHSMVETQSTIFSMVIFILSFFIIWIVSFLVTKFINLVFQYLQIPILFKSRKL